MHIEIVGLYINFLNLFIDIALFIIFFRILIGISKFRIKKEEPVVLEGINPPKGGSSITYEPRKIIVEIRHGDKETPNP